MDSLLNYQNDLSQRIYKSKSNFKKSPKDRLTQSYIESKLETLEQLWLEFRNNHKELMQTVKPELLAGDKYISNEIYDRTEEEYTDYKCELKRKLAPFITSTSKSNVDPVSAKENVKCSLVKLPKINIPSFSGNYSEWITFRDLYVSMIHNNESLDNVQKMQYLKGYLSGEAEQLIRYIPVTDCNYMQCWRQLEERYNNKKYISHSILKRLLSQRNATSESATFLKDLIVTSSDCLNALSNLGIDVSSWDIIVIHLLSLKLDTESRKQWELNVTANVKSDELPTFAQFRQFITGRYRALEFIDPKPSFKPTIHNVRPSNNQVNNYPKTLHVTEVAKISCEYCNEDHKLCFCKGFARLDYDAKHAFVSNNRMCYNCLGKNHSVRFCQKTTKCQICSKRHHSLLHPKGNSASSVNSGNLVHTVVATSEEASGAGGDTDDLEDSTVANHMAYCAKVKTNKQVLLATALVNVEDKSGEYQVFRALLDQGSQASFVTEATAQGLGLRKIPVNGMISGLGGNQSGMISKSVVILRVQSRLDPEFQMEIKAYVLQKITSFLPGKRMRAPEWIKAHQLYLADPTYNAPNKIDILLGADVYCQILKEGLLRGPAGTPVAQCTTLGWILSGQTNIESEENETVKVLHAWVNDNDIIKRFWELEAETTGASTKIFSEEELKCEEIFATTTTRNSEGRYVVKLPFREEEPGCSHGDSREIAVKRLKALERKLNKNVDLKEKYAEVINEYLKMGHMKLVPNNEEKRGVSVYLPHHAVIREDKSTTKVRVVFDASCKNTQGISLNDSLMIGPTLQPELRHLIMRWRRHPVCLIGDIVKMYRMVRVADEDTDYQRIVWRDNNDQEIKNYKLLTVTFGTASAPYLAVKALNQVALDHAAQYPLAAERVPKEFYMDDLMTGCESIEEGFQIYKEMTALLNEAGFTLQKWSSNKEELLREIDHTRNEKGQDGRKKVDIKTDNIVKILGLTWDREQDEFQYSVTLPPLNEPVTKRKIISDVARLFDPLGWIAPCVITAKIFIQRLWISGISWDEEAPEDIKGDWITYREQLPELTEFRIPRWLHTRCDDVVVELHGFCDASNVAYAATVYLRSINNVGQVRTCLISAKTRVAPVKQVSIPRLELCGAVLLSKLLVEVAEILNVSNNNIKAWTDSTVVLAWLSKHPCNWKTFVANRVSEILTVLDASHWYHVPTKENPADCASRGLQPRELKNHTLWKNGPSFLRNETIQYSKLKNNNTQEEESVKVHVGLIQEHLLNRFSSFGRMLRVIAYCRRFITRRKLTQETYSKHLKKGEIDEALVMCLKVAQATAFERDISEIKKYGQIKTRSSSILSLTPFLDDRDLLRVGGRLAHCQEEEPAKHPILLPSNSHLSQLIVANAHEKTYHGGPLLMLNLLRSSYWIVGAKNLVKRHVRKCVKCIRYKADQTNQLMGALPFVRVTPARPFSRSGVDYAGPISLRTTKGRGHHAYKAYICLFICMVTKAIHLEVVSDLTSRGFLEAFKRFVARRGHCYELYSDNATNFVGAAKELKELFSIEKSNMVQEIAESLANQCTTWHFIPPRAPNFGGLWEAGIRSTKFHIRRAIGDATLTYEEMSTLLSQIEACLNSRPISVMSNDIGDPSPLTPGHFLIGEPLVTIPEINYETSTVSTLKRWHLTQRMLQNFWRRWSNEYLSQHLQRFKWTQKLPEPQIGDIVLVKEDDLPPAKWLLGRIEQKHPGSDNLTRVVTLKCKNSMIKRPTSKLCILPVSSNLDDGVIKS